MVWLPSTISGLEMDMAYSYSPGFIWDPHGKDYCNQRDYKVGEFLPRFADPVEFVHHQLSTDAAFHNIQTVGCRAGICSRRSRWWRGCRWWNRQRVRRGCHRRTVSSLLKLGQSRRLGHLYYLHLLYQIDGHLFNGLFSRITSASLHYWLIKVLRPTWHRINHFRDVLPSQSLGFVLKKLN